MERKCKVFNFQALKKLLSAENFVFDSTDRCIKFTFFTLFLNVFSIFQTEWLHLALIWFSSSFVRVFLAYFWLPFDFSRVGNPFLAENQSKVFFNAGKRIVHQFKNSIKLFDVIIRAKDVFRTLMQSCRLFPKKIYTRSGSNALALKFSTR